MWHLGIVDETRLTIRKKIFLHFSIVSFFVSFLDCFSSVDSGDTVFNELFYF